MHIAGLPTAGLLTAQVIALVDLFFGDTGKGHIIDWLIWHMQKLGQPIDIVVSPFGGPNAGHQFEGDGRKYTFSQIPSVISPEVVRVCGNGKVINPIKFVAEMERLEAVGVNLDKLYISDKATIILPYYEIVEELLEIARSATGEAIGTTKSAIGPTYGFRAMRVALEMKELKRMARFREKLEESALIQEGIISGLKNAIIDQHSGLAEQISQIAVPDLESVFSAYRKAAGVLAPRLIDSGKFLRDEYDKGKRILIEPTQGAGLDNFHGTYPYVTGTGTGRGAMLEGTGINRIDFMIGITKCYATRVGAGPFPSEIDENDSLAALIRERGKEFGTMSGRSRRIGHRDLVYEKYACEMNDVEAHIVTKADVLDNVSPLLVGVKYLHRASVIDHVPSDINEMTFALHKAFEVYRHETQPKRYAEVHENCRRFLEFGEDFLGRDLFAVSFSPERDGVIVKE